MNWLNSKTLLVGRISFPFSEVMDQATLVKVSILTDGKHKKNHSKFIFRESTARTAATDVVDVCR